MKFSVAFFFLSSGLFLGGCEVPTLGSQFRKKPELTPKPFPNINTVPFGSQAFSSREWHEGDETLVRQEDEEDLEKQRLRLQAEGEKLRSQIFS